MISESKCQLCKQFHWRFLSRQRLSFRWLFVSQQGLSALTNPCIMSWSSFGDDFLVDNDIVFLEYFWVNRVSVRYRIQASALQAVSLMISEATATQFSLTISESTTADDFWVGNDTVFLNVLWVNRSCVRWRIQASAMQAVSLMIFESVETQISSTISESTGASCADESMRQLWNLFRWWFLSTQRLSFPWQFMSQQGLCELTNPSVSSASSFGDDFWVEGDSVFLEYLWVNRGCVRWRIQASPLQAISVMISNSMVTQFSLNIYESTGAVCADESKR